MTIRTAGLGSVVALLGLSLSPLAFSATLPISYSWTSPNGIAIVQSDGAGATTPAPVPGSYDYSHTVTTANAAATIPGSVSGSYPLGFEFYDDYVFTVTGAVANSVTSTISMGSLLGISSLQARLFQLTTPLPYIGAPPSGTLIQAWGSMFSCGSGCSGENVILANTVLAPGTYVLELRGIVSGSLSGSYGGALNLAPVPVPAAVWLFGSAVAGLGWMRRRSS
jgi:hypothetical protein